MIQTFTWSEFGYRRLPTTLQSAEAKRLVQSLGQIAGYEIKDGCWIRQPGRVREAKAKSFEKVAEFHSNSNDAGSFDFLSEYSSWLSRLQADGPLTPTCYASPEDLIEVLQREEEIGHEEPWHLLKAYGNILALSPNVQQLGELLRQFVLPSFFRRYPQGRLILIRHRANFISMASAMRSLYTSAQIPVSEWKNAGITDFGTLRDWHSADPYAIAIAILQLCQFLWYPYVVGVTMGPFGLVALFILEPPAEFQPPRFPRDWFAYLSHAGEFGTQRRNLFDALQDFDGPEYWQFAHRRPLQDVPEITDRVDFVDWLIGRLNSWLFNLCDVANFTVNQHPDADIDPIGAFEHFLTLDRIVRRLVAVASSVSIGDAKTMTFEMADLLATLKKRFEGGQDAQHFKTLFNPDLGLKMISDRLSRIPGVGTNHCKMASFAYSELNNTVIDSVRIRSKVSDHGVLVRNSDLSNEREEDHATFVANVVRALRNGHHGYFTEEDYSRRPSRYLSLVTGNVSDSLVVLPSLWFLAYLSDPQMLGWEPLSIGKYAE